MSKHNDPNYDDLEKLMCLMNSVNRFYRNALKISSSKNEYYVVFLKKDLKVAYVKRIARLQALQRFIRVVKNGRETKKEISYEVSRIFTSNKENGIETIDCHYIDHLRILERAIIQKIDVCFSKSYPVFFARILQLEKKHSKINLSVLYRHEKTLALPLSKEFKKTA